MIDSLGMLGWVGIAILVVGIVVIAAVEPLVALGMVLVLVGMGLVVKQGIDQVMGMFGMA